MNELERWKKYVAAQFAKYQPWMGPRRSGPVGYLAPYPPPMIAVPDSRSGAGGGATASILSLQGALQECVQQLAGGIINWGMGDAQVRALLLARATDSVAWLGQYDPDCAGSSVDSDGNLAPGPILIGLIDDVYVPLFRFAVTPQ